MLIYSEKLTDSFEFLLMASLVPLFTSYSVKSYLVVVFHHKVGYSFHVSSSVLCMVFPSKEGVIKYTNANSECLCADQFSDEVLAFLGL